MASEKSPGKQIAQDPNESRFAAQLQIAKSIVHNGVTANKIKFIGGLDISFRKEDPADSCGCLVVLDYATLQIVHTAYLPVTMTEEYQFGMLGFREVPVYMALLEGTPRSYSRCFYGGWFWYISCEGCRICISSRCYRQYSNHWRG
jgi:deoxyinosine 3'endonuclease (endonuclease V)